jgi:hypothetical protein
MTASTGGGINIGAPRSDIKHLNSFSEEHWFVLLAKIKIFTHLVYSELPLQAPRA